MFSECLKFTRYNNKTYRIDDIDWSVKPTQAFQKRDGSEVTYMDYYKQVGMLLASLLNLETTFSVLITSPVVVTFPTRNRVRGDWFLLVYSSSVVRKRWVRGTGHGRKLAGHTAECTRHGAGL